MTTRKTLPYDVARCHGADDPLCDRCARFLFSRRWTDDRDRTFIAPQIQDGQCPQFIDVEMSDD